MTQKVFFGRLALVLCLGLVGPAFAQDALTIGNGSAAGLSPVTVPVTMDASGDVQGYVLAVEYDTMLLSATDASYTAAAAAELVVPEIFEAQGGLTLGVVLDAAAPFDGQVIPAGNGIGIASLTFMPDMAVIAPAPDVMTDLVFTDGTFNNPPLDNIIVIGGFSIGAGQGLGLNGGTITLIAVDPDTLSIESASTPSNSGASVRVLLDLLTGPCQGFVLAIGHSGDVSLNGIDTGADTDAAGAEFVVPALFADGGTLGVVLDFDPPFGGQTIPTGMGRHLASYNYSCNTVVTCTQEQVDAGDCPPATVADISFQDGTFGSPALDNVIVIGGLSFNPGQVNGTLSCEPVIIAAEDTQFFCGVMDAEGNIVDPTGAPGDTVQMCFYYTECDGLFGEDQQPANIQGFQLALSYDCDLEFKEGTFSIEGSILEAVGAEFVSHSVDNVDGDDGDGCELTVGILLDALPPFDRQTAPPTCDPLLIGCIDVCIAEDADCDTCLPVTFENGVNGSENVPIENIVVAGNQSIQGFDTFDCNICVIAAQEFQRGDCNGDTKVDLADASSVLAQQFQGFPVPCLDACDANDDGKINLADTVFILNYLFDSGPPPPAPGPDLDPGIDPSDDNLDCEEGTSSCGG